MNKRKGEKLNLRRHKLFWRILLFYLSGSVLLIGVFSAVLTAYLTRQAQTEATARNRNTLGQVYSAVSYALNTSYDTYYKMYQSADATELMFSHDTDVDDTLAVYAMINKYLSNKDCVASVYLINQAVDRVYYTDGNDGGFASLDDFFDQQAIWLFNFYDETSNTLFLPRTASFSYAGSPTEETHSYITFIFSRRNAVRIPMGGLIVNLDETALINLISNDFEAPDELYIISENGSILANADPSKVNTSIYGSPLWNEVTAHSGEDEFFFLADYNGEECLVTGKNAPRLRFCFLQITPMSRLLTDAKQIRTFILIFAGIFLIFAFILSAFSSRLIYSPISNLLAGIKGWTSQTPADNTELLWPVNTDEISFLNNAYQSLSNQVNTLSKNNALLEQIACQEILSHLLSGDYQTPEDASKAARQLGLPEDDEFIVVLIRFDDFSKLSHRLSSQDLGLCRYALYNITDELLNQIGKAWCTEYGNDGVCSILQVNCDITEPLSKAFATLTQTISGHLNTTVTAGISMPVSGLMNISHACLHAETALSYRLVFGCGTEISYKQIEARERIMAEYPIDTEADILQALKSRNTSKTDEEINRFFSCFALANADSINMAVNQLTISLSRAAHSIAASPGNIRLPDYQMLSTQLEQLDTLTQKRTLLASYCHKIIEIRNNNVRSKKETQIDSIKEFIEANYTNPMLSTEEIAAFADLSSNYLRTVFKNATGKSPNEYLTDFRMERAQELLANTDATTKEIATAVGFYNHRYFYTVFKSKTGLTATDYRKNSRSDSSPGNMPVTDSKNIQASADKNIPEEYDEI